MALVTYRNLLDEDSEFKSVDRDSLIGASYEYARANDELYQLVMKQKVTLYVNDRPIHPDDWAGYTVTDTDHIIITPVIAGGGSGGWLKIIIGVIIIVASIITQQYYGITGGLAMMGVMAGVSVGVGLVFGGISELLFKSDLPSLPSMSFGGGLSGATAANVAGGGKQTQTYNWGGISTMARYNTPVPIIYGTHAVGGNVISMFTSIENKSDDYLYTLIALSEGEIDGICLENNNASVCTTSDRTSSSYRAPAIELNNQPLSNYTDIEWWYRKGTNATNLAASQYNPNYQNKIPHFDGARVQYDDGRELTTTGIVYTTTKPVDMVEVQISAPSLYDASTGMIKEKTVEYKVEYKPTDSGTYTTYKGEGSVSSWAVTSSGSQNVIVAYSDGSTKKYFDPGTYTLEILGNNFAERVAAYAEYTTIQYAISIKITNEQTKEVTTGDIVNTITRNLRLGTLATYMGEKTEYPTSTIITDPQTNEYTYGVPYIPNTNAGSESQVYIGSCAQAGGTEVNPHYTTDWLNEGYTVPVRTYTYCSIPVYYYTDHIYVDGEQHSYTGQEIGEYKVTLTQNVTPGSVYTITSTETSSVIVGQWIPIQAKSTSTITSKVVLDFNYLPSGNGVDEYDIKITRRYPRSDDINVADNLVVRFITEVVQGQFIYPNTALLGLRIKATGQLSGSVPNIVTTVRGTKVQSPSMSTGRFEDCFYDDAQDRFEDSSGNEVTWDESTYSSAWSNNSMLVVQDLLLNTRYGIGRYIDSNDLYSLGIITAIKECHIEYNPFSGNEPDYLSWYSGGVDADWNQKWRFTLGSGTSSSSSRYIDTDGNYHAYSFEFDLDLSLPTQTTFTFTTTIANSNANYNITILGKTVSGIQYELLTFTNQTDGEISNTFVNTIPGISRLIVIYTRYNSDSTFDFRITDMSLTATIRDHNHTWDGVMESEQSALMALFEMCDSWRCWPVWFDGKFNFIINKDETPTQFIGMSNIIEGSFSQSFTALSEIPYLLSGQYTDRDYKYKLRSLSTTLDTPGVNKTNEKTVGLKGITCRQKAERELKFKLNTIHNCNHVTMFKCGLDAIHSTAGDIVYVQHQLPAWGWGGRITDYEVATKTVTLDATMTFSNCSTDTYVIKWQTPVNVFVTATINSASIGNVATKTLKITTWPTGNNPATDAAYIAGLVTNYKKFRLLSVGHDTVDTVSITALEHVASIYTTNATITKYEDRHSNLPDVLNVPKAPSSISIEPTDKNTGIGFHISVQPSGGSNIKETVVQFNKEDDANYTTLAVLPLGQTEFTYVDNNLQLNKTYYFKAFSKAERNISKAIYTRFHLNTKLYTLDPPKGIHIKGMDVTTTTFDTRDITISWKEVSSSSAAILDGYEVHIYKYSYAPQNELRVAFTRSNEYTYTYADNLSDSGTAYPSSGLVFIVYTRTMQGALSGPSAEFKVSNKAPSAIGSITTESIEDGAKFSWSGSTANDFQKYQVRTQVGALGWSSWTDNYSNNYTRFLTTESLVNMIWLPYGILGIVLNTKNINTI